MTAIAIINTKAPFGKADGQESLDLALAGGSFGQTIALFFTGDGVFQLVENQSPEKIEHRNYSKTFAALEFYDIEDVYVCQQSLAERGLTQQDLCIETALFKPDELTSLLSQSNHVVRM